LASIAVMKAVSSSVVKPGRCRHWRWAAAGFAGIFRLQQQRGQDKMVVACARCSYNLLVWVLYPSLNGAFSLPADY
jgi:hypothetical protein